MLQNSISQNLLQDCESQVIIKEDIGKDMKMNCVEESGSVKCGSGHGNQVIINKRHQASYSCDLSVWRCQAVRCGPAVLGMQLHLCMAGNV